jgi:hypothetical protein
VVLFNHDIITPALSERVGPGAIEQMNNKTENEEGSKEDYSLPCSEQMLVPRQDTDQNKDLQNLVLPRLQGM